MVPEFAEFTGATAQRSRFAAQAPSFPPPLSESAPSQHISFSGVSIWYAWHKRPEPHSLNNKTLTRSDFAEYGEIRDATQRRRSLATRALLRRALSEAAGGIVKPLDWEFERGAHGKPTLSSPVKGLNFSCSHTHSVSVIAVSRSKPIGIDVEAAIPAHEDSGWIADFFAAGEKRALQRLPFEARAAACARLWSLKEATVKMLGTGLALDVSKLEFDIEADRLASSQVPEINASGMRLATWSIPDNAHSLSVALTVKI